MALGESGDQRESAHALYVAGGAPARHAPWPAAMELIVARGQGSRRHENTRDSVEKNAGKVGELTGATKTVRTARFGLLACGGSRRSSASSYAVRTESGREGKWGGEGARARGSAHLKPMRGVGRTGDRGRGLRLGGSKLRERGKTGERLGEIELTGSPACQRVGERGERGNSIFSFFLNTFFHLHFPK